MGQRNSQHCVDETTKILLFDRNEQWVDEKLVTEIGVVWDITYNLALPTAQEIVDEERCVRWSDTPEALASINFNPVYGAVRFNFENPPDCMLKLSIGTPPVTRKKELITTDRHTIVTPPSTNGQDPVYQYRPAVGFDFGDLVRTKDRSDQYLGTVLEIEKESSNKICSLIVASLNEAQSWPNPADDPNECFFMPRSLIEQLQEALEEVDFIDTFHKYVDLQVWGPELTDLLPWRSYVPQEIWQQFVPAQRWEYGVHPSDLSIFGNWIANGTVPIHTFRHLWSKQDYDLNEFWQPRP